MTARTLPAPLMASTGTFSLRLWSGAGLLCSFRVREAVVQGKNWRVQGPRPCWRARPGQEQGLLLPASEASPRASQRPNLTSLPLEPYMTLVHVSDHVGE